MADPAVPPVDTTDAAAALAVSELALAKLREDSDDERLVLRRLRREVAVAADHVQWEHGAALLEANERLVLALLRAHGVAEVAKRALQEAERPVEHDPLTALPNRALLLDRLAQAVEHCKRHGTRLALLFVDVDNFKKINDTRGHAVGDQVLRIVGQRLSRAARAIDTVCRHGGDEFLVLLTEIDHVTDAVQRADTMVASLAQPMTIGARQLRITASIGIGFYPDDGQDAETLIDCADRAMYRAKRSGGGSHVFDEHAATRGERAGRTASGSPVTPELEPSHAERLNVQIQEANGRLIQAALGAQELHAAALHAQRQQQDFLAVMTHELRNPLTSIRIAVSMLELDQGSPLSKYQRVIDQEVTQMSRLINDLLDVSRVNTGKLRLDCAVLDIVALIERAVVGCRPRMESRRQAIKVQLPAQPQLVFGDSARLLQIIVNLLDNASKYTPESGSIEVNMVAADDLVVLTVSDTGIGIPAETLSRVFEPFQQDRHASAFNNSGLGIGLTIVRELVEAHGGEVVAISDGTGCGSRFVVTLPLTSDTRAS